MPPEATWLIGGCLLLGACSEAIAIELCERCPGRRSHGGSLGRNHAVDIALDVVVHDLDHVIVLHDDDHHRAAARGV